MTRLIALCWLLAASPAAAEEVRYAVVVGNNIGGAHDEPLRYAERDAERVRDALESSAGIAAANLVMLRRPDAETLQRALIRVNDRIRAEARPGDQTALFVYYSGHADARSLHTGTSSLPITVLEQLVRGSPADLRVLILDSCQSGALTRVKGGRHVPPFPVTLGSTRPADGVVFLTSSSNGEDAYESDFVKGSFFTHYLVSAILGVADVDRDGAVSLSEAYRYAYDNTVRASTESAPGVQHATFRYELKGHDDIVVSRPGAAKSSATLRFAAGRTYYVFASNGALVAEVVAGDRSVAIHLAAGTYHVRGRERDYLLEGDVLLRSGEVVEAVSTLRRLEYDRLVRKGTGALAATLGLEAGLRVRTPLDQGEQPCIGPYAAVAFDLRHASVAPFVSACRSTLPTGAGEITTDELAVGGWAGRVVDLRAVSVGVSLTAAATLFHQSVAPEPASWTAAGLAGASVRVSSELPGGFYVALDAIAELHVREHVVGGLEAEPAARFGMMLGKRWVVSRAGSRASGGSPR